MSRYSIIKGEDRVLSIEVIRKANDSLRRPFDLTGYTKITVEFKKSNGILSIDDVPAHGRFSSATYEDVTYTADSKGVIGNSISLVFDGIDDIATVIANWNAANPANTVSSDAADDSVVPTSTTLNLTGGLDDYSKISVIGNPELGQITVQLDNEDTNSLATGTGQNIKIIVDFGAHDLGNRRIAIAKNVLNVVSDPL